MRFFYDEVKELVISALVLGFCFAWIFRHQTNIPASIFYGLGFIEVFLIMLIALGLSFIGHELLHKAIAQKYGCWAKYKMWETGLIIAFFMAIATGIVFAAPGAVYIQCTYYGMSKRENGLISASGPVGNLFFALLFLTLALNTGFLGTLGKIGFFINSWLAFFNMLPFPPLDGSKVIRWSLGAWAAIGIISLIFWRMSFGILYSL